MLQPVVRRTLAPRGQTPILECWDRHDRLSVISALTLAPQRQRLGLYFDIHSHNIRADDVYRFIQTIRGRLRRKIILVLDRWSVHRAAIRHLLERHARNIDIELLPAYAPNSTLRNRSGTIRSMPTWPITSPMTSMNSASRSPVRYCKQHRNQHCCDPSSTGLDWTCECCIGYAKVNSIRVSRPLIL